MEDRDFGIVVTDAEGGFEVELDGQHRFLVLEVLECSWTFSENHRPVEATRVLNEVRLPFGPGEHGDVGVSIWPYRSDFPSPRSGWMNGKACQSYTPGYHKVLLGSFAKVMPVKALLAAEHKVAGKHLSLERVQKHLPETATTRQPVISRSDAWLADQLLNGFDIELRVGRNAENPEQLRVRIAWPEMPPKNELDLSDVDITLEDQDGTLMPVRIIADVRSPKDGAYQHKRTVSVPGDACWEAAKRLVRCQYLLHGALDGHILRTHMQTEMYAIAVFRNLRKSPVLRILGPHLKEIVAQNHDGDGFAWGPDGIVLVQSSLTMDHVNRRISEKLGGWDWSTFSPREPLRPSHRYAYAGQRFWALLKHYVGSFLAEHRPQIQEQWLELKMLSKDLVEHAAPYVPQVADSLVLPVDQGELDQPMPPRPVHQGVARAVRHLTEVELPVSEDWQRLEQFICYVLYQCTFNHSWTHDGQYQAGGELAYATFGLRGGSLAPESETDVLPPFERNLDSITTNAVGIKAGYGFLLADEDGDVPPQLKQALQDAQADFAALGVDVAKIRSRINI